MRKIISTIVIVGLVVAPISAFAQASGGAGTTGGSAGTQGTVMGCQSTVNGGSLGDSVVNALLNRLPGDSGAILADLMNGKGVSGVIGGALGGGILGNTAGSIANQALDSITGGAISNLGGTLGGLAGNFSGAINNLGGGLSGILGGSSGILGGVLGGGGGGGILGGLTGGAGGLLGGLGGGLLGGVTGGILGGGSVPVSDKVAQKIQNAINADTTGINSDTAALLRKECVTDPMTRRIAQMTRANITKSIVDWGNTGFAGGTYYVQPQYFTQAYNNSNTQFIQGDELNAVSPTYQSYVREQLAKNFQYETSFQNQVGCSITNPEEFLQNGTTQNGMSYWDTWNAIFAEPGCTPGGAALIADNERRARAEAKVEEAQWYAEQGNGYFPVVECLDEEGGDTIIECENFTVVTPASLVQAEYQGAVKAGEDELANTDETGEVIDALFSQLGELVFTSLSGALGLSQSGSSGTGSYLDQLTGATGSGTVTQTQSFITSDIQAAIVVQTSYQVILEEIIANLKSVANSYEAVRACYAKLTNSLNISPAIALERAEAASTTAAILTPQITARTAELVLVKQTGAQLASLLVQAGQAQTAQSISALSATFNNLSANGSLYNTTDATLLANDRDSSAVTLSLLKIDADEQLAVCKAL